MSTATSYLEDLLARGHLQMATTLGRTIDMQAADGSTLYSGLYAIVRNVNKREQEILKMIVTAPNDIVFEVPIQSTFTGLLSGNVIEPHHIKIVYGSYTYEVRQVGYDDIAHLTTGEIKPSVITFYCSRMGAGAGEIAL